MPDIQMKNELISIMEALSESELLTARRFIEFLIAQRGDSSKKPSKDERKAAAKRLLGIFAHLPGGSEEFMIENHEDNEREEQKFKERCR